MKIAHSLGAFLSLNQYLELPSIGKFELEYNVSEAEQGSAKRQIIMFTQSNKPEPDPSFISFICQRFRIDPYVAISDLKSFCDSVNELLMQGFEAEIPQIGYLMYNKNHELEFSTSSRYKTMSKIYRRKIAPVFKSSFWL